MNFAGKLGIFAFVIAGGMVFAAEKFNMPQLIPLALGLFGLFGIALGIETIASGKIEMFNRLYSRRENFTGLPARLFGVMILLFGTLVLFYAFYEWTSPGAAGKFLAGLVGSSRGWGILLLAFGFFTLLFGSPIVMILGVIAAAILFGLNKRWQFWSARWCFACSISDYGDISARAPVSSPVRSTLRSFCLSHLGSSARGDFGHSKSNKGGKDYRKYFFPIPGSNKRIALVA